MNPASRRNQPRTLQLALRAAVRCTLGPNEDREPALEAIDAVAIDAPSALRVAYATLAGCTIVPEHGDPTDVLDADELRSANADGAGERAGAVFFARDGATGLFFVDTRGEISGAVGAVLWADRARAVLVAYDVAGFLHAAARGELNPRKRPTLDDTRATELSSLLHDKRERWVGAPPRDVVEIFEQGIRVGCRIFGDLEIVLAISDGMELPYAHVVLWPASRIERAGHDSGLPENAYEQVRLPTGLWIGTRGERRLLYITGHTTWRGLTENTIVAVADGEPIDEAPVLGRLGTLVRTWVG